MRMKKLPEEIVCLKNDGDCLSTSLLTLGIPSDVIKLILDKRHVIKDEAGNILKKGTKIKVFVELFNEQLLNPFGLKLREIVYKITSNKILSHILRYIYNLFLEINTRSILSYNYFNHNLQKKGGHIMLIAKSTDKYLLIDPRAPRPHNSEIIFSQDNLIFDNDSSIYNFFKHRDTSGDGILSVHNVEIYKISIYMTFDINTHKKSTLIWERGDTLYNDLKVERIKF